MSLKIRLLAVAVVALAVMACGITVNLPVDRIVTGPAQTEQIIIEPPDAKIVDLTLDFGAGELKVGPGAGGLLVSGTATYNAEDLKPEIKESNNEIRLSTGELNIEGIPSFKGSLENKWNLQLGSQTMNLKIHAGAYDGNMDLGGLALKTLDIVDGAANTQLRFSSPNPVEMDSFRYQTGASTVKLSELANANFTSMIFRSGAGDYRLDFSGELQRDAVVTVEAGFSQVVISVPEGTSAKVITAGSLSNIEASALWVNEGKFYSFGSGGPTLTITVDLGAGNLVLETK